MEQRFEDDKVEGPCIKVLIEEMTEVLNLINARKAAGPSGMTCEVLKVCEKEGVKRLAKVANDMLKRKNMP